MTKSIDRVVVDYDPDPDFSWLDPDDDKDHVALEMVAYDEDGEVIDCLCGIDFYEDANDWRTGTFYRVEHLRDAPYLQEIARGMGLPRIRP